MTFQKYTQNNYRNMYRDTQAALITCFYVMTIMFSFGHFSLFYQNDLLNRYWHHSKNYIIFFPRRQSFKNCTRKALPFRTPHTLKKHTRSLAFPCTFFWFLLSIDTQRNDDTFSNESTHINMVLCVLRHWRANRKTIDASSCICFVHFLYESRWICCECYIFCEICYDRFWRIIICAVSSVRRRQYGLHKCDGIYATS